jgi:RNA polymerase sigma factor (sigma-70 family)
MLKLWQLPAADEHRDLFLSRYSQILAWALKLTGHRREQAEDLVQDAFVFLVNARPDLTAARNLDAYLYVLVRNLHRAQLQKLLRGVTLPLDILEFDSVDAGLREAPGTNDEDRLWTQNELRRICDFACRRRETSRVGSVLILRFFHGYYPREIAAILRCSRAVVDVHLRLGRKECRDWLDAPRTLEVVAKPPASRNGFREARLSATVVTNDALLAELREIIFSAPKGDCPSRAQLREIYRRGSSARPGQAIVAHIISCAECLDAVNGFLGLAKLKDRDPNDTTGYGTDGPSSSKRRGAQMRSAPFVARPSARQLSKWGRRAASVLEHRPSRLCIAVNGLPLVDHLLNSQESDLTITVPIREQVDFVEVLSEQGVRLAMLVVVEPPPLGDLVQTTAVTLSGQRTLHASLSFDNPWPTIHVTYSDPSRQTASDEIAQLERPHEEILFATAFVSDEPRDCSVIRQFITGLLSWLFNPELWLNAKVLSSGVAILMILVLLLVQTHETTASAATLISRAEQWQRSTAKSGQVLHRTFDLIERRKSSSITSRRRVEVWQRPDNHDKVSHLLDSSGKLLNSVRLTGTPRPLTLLNAWQFDPAPETFRQLAGDLNQARVKKFGGRIELIAPSVSLELDDRTFAPTGETVDVEGAEFEFREIATEPMPESASPLAAVLTPQPVAAVRGRELKAVVIPALAAEAPTEAELEQSEISARVILHELRADLGEDIRVQRRGPVVEVAGVVDSLARKEQLAAGLSPVPYVRVSLLAPEDLASTVNDRIVAALASSPEQARATHPPLLENWLETAYPNEDERRSFATRTVDLARDCARRALAVREIAQRYGKPNDPAVAQILQDHLGSIRQDLTALDEELADVIQGALIKDDPSGAGAEPPSWTDAVNRLFVGARVLESDTVVLLTTSDANGQSPQTVLRNWARVQLDTKAAMLRLIRSD